MPYIGNTPAEKYAAFNVQYFTTSATTSYTLDRAVANELDIRLVINNVIQEPGAGKAYTAANTTLTLTSATAGTDTMYAVYIGKAVQTVTPGANSVGPTALQDNSVTNAKLADATQGDVIYYGAAGAPAQLSAGTSGFFLKTQGAGANPIWAADNDTVSTTRPNANPLIINGDFAVAQRTTSTSSVSSGSNFVSDRFTFGPTTAGTWTISQEAITSGSPFDNGFRTGFKADNTTANGSLSAGSNIQFAQKIEAQDLQLLKYGSSNAEKLTLAFWIKATKTGTNVIEIYAHDSGRSVSVAYTVSSSDTWEYKVVNLPADTGGTINNDNGTGLEFIWWLAAGTNFTSGSLQTSWAANSATARAVGQVNHADSTSNNVHIAGVQLEVGEYTLATIPSFLNESYGDNLARCQRYYEKSFEQGTAPVAGTSAPDGRVFASWDGASARTQIDFATTKRASPTVTVYRGSNSGSGTGTGTANFLISGSWSNAGTVSNHADDSQVSLTGSTSSFTANGGYVADMNFTANAEL